MLDNAPLFSWENLSVPEHEPIHASDGDFLKFELRNQLRQANIVIACAGMWVPRSRPLRGPRRLVRRPGARRTGPRPIYAALES